MTTLEGRSDVETLSSTAPAKARPLVMQALSPSTTTAAKSAPSKNDAPKDGFVNSLLERGQYSPENGGSTPHGDKSWSRCLQGRKMSKPTSPRPFDYHFVGDIRAVDKFSPGYSQVAAHMDTDPGFKIFRKFGWLHNFALLHLQDELQQLEERLEQRLKREDEYGYKPNLRSRRLDLTSNKNSRNDLMSAIQAKLAQYDDLLLRNQQVQAIKRPLPRYQNAVFHAVTNDSNMQGDEGSWICRSDDLAAVSDDAEHGWFNGVVEDFLNKVSRRGLLFFFRNKELKHRTGDGPDTLVSPRRMDALIRAILTICLSVQLLIPLLILNRMQTNNPSQVQQLGYDQIAVIFGCTLIFSVSCSIFTRARRHEVFAATAAYCAVLVVFLGNSSSAYPLPQPSPPY